MRTAIGHLRGLNPATRFTLAAIAVVLLVANALVLVGFTHQVTGSALPSSPSLAGLPSSLGLTPSPSAASTEAAPLPAPAPAKPAPVPARPAPAPVKKAPPSPTASQHRPEWPTSIPDPDEFRNGRHGHSPFAQRCRNGQIPASLCHGFPGGGNG